LRSMREHLLDPQILSSVSNFPLLARTVVEGFIAGLHRSLFHGFGSEFVQYRDYVRGDDPKYIDWKVYARQGSLQLKIFQEETNTNVYIVLDCSASMAYDGGAGISKLRYGSIIAACLAYLIGKQGDNVGFSAYHSDLVCNIKPGHRSGQVHQICTELARLEPGGVCEHRKIFNILGESFNRRGIVILISDFLDANESVRKGISRFRFSHHDLILFQVLDSHELEFPFDNTVRFVDSESGDEIITAPEVVRERYLDAFQAYLGDFKGFCMETGIDYQLLSTRDPLANALAAYLHRREQIR
jgi:uncharacterized protein (DUF58 family)